MPKRIQLPSPLVGAAFTTADGIAAGLSPDRLRASDVRTPFHGVKSTGLDFALLVDRCRAYEAWMHRSAAYSHSTAALLWGMPLPARFGRDTELHVTTPAPIRAPRSRGVIGHQRQGPFTPVQRGKPRVVPAAEAWCDLAEQVQLHDLIAAGEFVITGDPFNDVLPLASVEELERAAGLRSHSPGAAARRAALAVMEEGPLSRPETLMRLLLIGAGLPHPSVNVHVTDERGSFLAMPDLAWREYRVALEYEGDFHRSKARFRSDIRRVELLVDHGWLVVKASVDDIFDLPRELVERVVRRLSSRGWVPGRIRLPQNGIYER